MEACRACLTTGDVENMVLMDAIFKQNYNTLTGLNVNLCEDLYTCKLCLDRVTFYIEFKNKCIESDLAWKEMNRNIKSENLTLNTIEDQIHLHKEEDDKTPIKEEKKHESEDDIHNDDNFEYSYDEFYHKSKNDEVEVEPKTIRKSKRHKTNTLLKQYEEERIPVRKNNRCKDKTVVFKENIDEKSFFSCGLCMLQLEDKPSVSEHLVKHKGDMECKQCQERFLNLPHLLSHRFEHIPAEQKFCHICDMKFLTTPGLEFHYMRKHEMAKKNETIACKKCFLTFNSKKALLAHIASKHSDLYKCDVCGQGYGHKNLLKLHLKKHSADNKAYKCKLCDYTSKFSSGLYNHMLRKHTKGRVYCNTCNRVHRSKAELDKHVCKHLKYFMCPVCGVKVNGNLARLKGHMMTHDEVPRFECDQCSQRFKNKVALRFHLDKHAGKPRYQCSYCQRKFYHGSALCKHKRTHTGEKPYVCKICNKGFTGNHNLKVHMKVHGITNIIKKKEKTEDFEFYQVPVKFF